MASPRLFVLAALAVGPMVLATACGGEATGARTTLATVQPSSYVVEDPVPTTAPPATSAPDAGGVEGQVSEGEQSYTVVSGDSVYRIADIHGIDPVVLANYNAWAEGINHPLQIGDLVKIPPGAKVPGTGSTDSGSTGSGSGTSDTSPDTPDTPDTTAPSEEIACEYTIVEGDNPTRVADKTGVTVDELANANVGNSAYGNFLIGSKLNIPAGGSC